MHQITIYKPFVDKAAQDAKEGPFNGAVLVPAAQAEEAYIAAKDIVIELEDLYKLNCPGDKK
jgi:hypothetical protein